MALRPQVLLLTDSLGFPRAEPEFVAYEQSYVALLRDAFPQCDIVHQGRGGATIRDLFNHSAYYHGTMKPDLVLIQSGIVDCAPRTLTLVEQQVVTRLPLLSRPLGALVKRYSRQLRRLRGITYTPLPQFEHFIERFEAQFPNACWIGILPASPGYEAQVEGITRNVERYNDVLRHRRWIDTTAFTPDDIMSDFHHLNVRGHRRMADAIAPAIASLLARAPAGQETATA